METAGTVAGGNPKRRRGRPRLILSAVLFCLTLSAVLYGTRSAWLPALWRALVVTGKPVKADAAVVPYHADHFSEMAEHISHAATLVAEGYVDNVLVDEGQPYYDRTVCDLWVPLVLDRTGLEGTAFECVGNDGASVSGAVGRLVSVLNSRGAKRVLLVTADSASRRMRRAFGKAAPDIHFTMVNTPRERIAPRNWWTSRDGQEAFALEVVALLLDVVDRS